MWQRLTLSTAIISLMTACATAQEPEATAPGWLVKDYHEFVEQFEGRWDSDRHVFFAEDAGMETAQIAPRQHIEIAPAVLSEEADPDALVAVFQAVRTVEGEDPATLVHTISLDAARQQIRQSIALPGGVLPPSPAGCDVYWQRQGGQFQGEAVGEGCDALFPRPVSDAPLDVSMMLSDKDFWVTAARGSEMVEARLRRARPFECWTAILRGASHGDSGQGMRDWDFRRGVTLHDQGGEAVLMTDEEEPRKIRLRLRNVDWPYGTNRPSLTLYIMEGESDRAVSYTWNEGDAERIGINLRWIQASCTYTPDDKED
ncbi:MAG: hypothetical protein AAF269_17005 [Pseudomonadota bacterium]